MQTQTPAIPNFALYGEATAFPDILHVEEILDRAADLNWIIAPHRHRHLHQIVHLRQGTARITIEGAAQTFLADTLVNLPSGTAHSFDFGPHVIGTVITLPVVAWPEYFGPNAESTAILSQPFITPTGPQTAQHIAQLLAAHRATTPFRHLHLRAASATLLLDILALSGRARQRAQDPRILDLRMMIDDTPNITLTVADCAARLAMSPRHLSRLSLSQTGRPVQTLIHEAVTREACRNLAYTRLQIATIAHQLGFDEPSYFSRFFTRMTGTSPSQYRARLNG